MAERPDTIAARLGYTEEQEAEAIEDLRRSREGYFVPRGARDRLAALVWAEVKTSGQWQYEVANHAGITEKHLSQLFHGKVGMSVDMADRLLAAVGRRLVIGTELITEAADHG